MSQFFTSDPDPIELASMLVGAAVDCLPTGNAQLDAFISEIAQRYEAQGGHGGFEGDVQLVTEDVETALRMAADQSTFESVRDLAAMNLMALEEARSQPSWEAESEDMLDWAEAGEAVSAHW